MDIRRPGQDNEGERFMRLRVSPGSSSTSNSTDSGNAISTRNLQQTAAESRITNMPLIDERYQLHASTRYAAFNTGAGKS